MFLLSIGLPSLAIGGMDVQRCVWNAAGVPNWTGMNPSTWWLLR